MDAQTLYKDVVASERLLRDNLKKGNLPQPNDPLRESLLEKALVFTAKYPAFSASKETEQVLWKPCFYKCIESFRRSIRKYAAASNGDRRVREHFFHVSVEFQTFLDGASTYYEKLHDAFEAEASVEAVRHSMFRCLIFLGDIARYRELHSQKAKKNFAAAEAFYHRALAVLPENGNPHNQLAVLATYVEAETIAVYRYCRSLLVPQPFVTSSENLALLFERARQRPMAPPSPPLTQQSPPKDKSAFLKSFLHRLTRLHGWLLCDDDDAYPAALEAGVVADFGALLAAGVMGDALLLKLCAINMYCLHLKPASKEALRLTLALLTHTLTYVAAHEEKTALLGPVGIMADFFGAHSDLLATEGATPFLEALVVVLNGVALALADDGDAGDKVRLKERLELRCFEPLDGGCLAPRAVLEPLPEPAATAVRCANLVQFGRLLTSGGLLYWLGDRFATAPPSQGSAGMSVPASDEDEEDFDDEVIVFRPAHLPLVRDDAFPTSPTFGGADLSAFRHLGGGLRPESVWGSSARIDPIWQDLQAVEAEGTRYAHEVSSLSMFFKPEERAPPSYVPPVVTRNPFFVVGNS
ncbi:hypothetical protein ACHHYP_03220 [Achlya hypogyna]|uniref:Telomerase-binding protein EST1A n=1 Tax=Achlya hypogyna TaxID=1202772 RepID=A0A1V9Z478_ACHHY|nr:hypothetical protein ACHHYP_03220 [Achlya hypogyna]